MINTGRHDATAAGQFSRSGWWGCAGCRACWSSECEDPRCRRSCQPRRGRACRDAGLIFVGPRTDVLERLGDKLAARKIAQEANVPVLGGSDTPLRGAAQAGKLAAKLGYPVMVKAAMGGGGRGMRVAQSA